MPVLLSPLAPGPLLPSVPIIHRANYQRVVPPMNLCLSNPITLSSQTATSPKTAAPLTAVASAHPPIPHPLDYSVLPAVLPVALVLAAVLPAALPAVLQSPVPSHRTSHRPSHHLSYPCHAVPVVQAQRHWHIIIANQDHPEDGYKSILAFDNHLGLARAIVYILRERVLISLHCSKPVPPKAVAALLPPPGAQTRPSPTPPWTTATFTRRSGPLPQPG